MVQWNFAAGFELLEKHQELGVSLFVLGKHRAPVTFHAW